MIAKPRRPEGLGKIPVRFYLRSIHSPASPILRECCSVQTRPCLEFYADRDAKSRKSALEA
jgi:hypothetical protein